MDIENQDLEQTAEGQIEEISQTDSEFGKFNSAREL